MSEEMMDWLPIETAPKDGAEFLAFGSYLYCDDKAPTIYFGVACYSGNEDWPWEDAEGMHSPEFFSHWMPLPEPPTAETAI